jgi:Tfp pilus assembly pilus retraction ATPase PilT
MVLVTGPTGSGKTTTLYSALSELNKVEREHQHRRRPRGVQPPGINQVQMHDDIGLNFAAALRSFLRQDPDIIMVGEIRDFETAEIASRPRSRATWCSRRCTPTTPRATISRLLNMGIEPFLVTAASTSCSPSASPEASAASARPRSSRPPPRSCSRSASPPRGDRPGQRPALEGRRLRQRATARATRAAWRSTRSCAVGRAQGAGAPGRLHRGAQAPGHALRHAHAAHERHRPSASRASPPPRKSCASRPPTATRLSQTPSPRASASTISGGLQPHQLLKVMVEKGASDLHITTGSPPQLRIDGQLVPLKRPAAHARGHAAALLLGPHRGAEASSRSTNELDLSFGVKGLSRFRANLFMQRGAVAGAFRAIPFKISSTSRSSASRPWWASSPTSAARPRARHRPHGLGQEHHARAIIDKINTETRQHIITIEDPIEYLHPHKNSRGQPARGRHRHLELQGRAQVRAAAGPGRRAGRRDARPGDHRGRAHHRRDGPPGLRHAPHQQRRGRPSTASSTCSPRTSSSRSARSSRSC